MKKLLLISTLCIWTGLSVHAQRQMEYLNRGVYAVNEGNGKVFVSWRLMEDEGENVGF